jgi:YggT family protein
VSNLLIQFVGHLTTVIYVAILGRVVMSWVSVDRSSPFYPVVAIIYRITEPILGPIRSVLPNFGTLDLSPMVALLLIWFIRYRLFSL